MTGVTVIWLALCFFLGFTMTDKIREHVSLLRILGFIVLIQIPAGFIKSFIASVSPVAACIFIGILGWVWYWYRDELQPWLFLPKKKDKG